MTTKTRLLNASKQIHLDKQLINFYLKLRYSRFNHPINPNLFNYPTVDYVDEGIILFPILDGARITEMIAKSLISHALHLRGYKTKFILCGRKIPICIEKTIDGGPNCYHCHYLSKIYASSLNIPVSWLEKYLTEEDYINAKKIASSLIFEEFIDFNYKKIRIGRFAEAATKRFLQKGTLQKNEMDIDIFRKFIESSILLVDFSESIFRQFNISHLITSNRAYLSGILVDFFSQKGVNCIECDFAIHNDTLVLNKLDSERRSIFHISQEQWENYKALSLSKNQKEELSAILSSRRRGIGMVINYGRYAQQTSVHTIKNSLKISSEKNIGILFTNVIWDASMIGTDIIFKDPFEWINETINCISKNKNDVLIIKVHPSEDIVGTKESFYDYIHSEFNELPKNIRLLPPKSKISTYDLFNIADYGLVYTTTAGLEMAYYGKPTIVTAETHYRGKGFTFDPVDKEDYIKMLVDNAKLQMSPEMKELAEKYAYLHFVDMPIKFKFLTFGEDNFNAPKLNINSWRDLLPGNDENIDRICDGIINDKDFIRSFKNL